MFRRKNEFPFVDNRGESHEVPCAKLTRIDGEENVPYTPSVSYRIRHQES